MNVCLGGFVKSNIITLEKTTATQTDEFWKVFKWVCGGSLPI